MATVNRPADVHRWPMAPERERRDIRMRRAPRPASRSRRCPQGDREDARAAIDAARAAADGWASTDRVRARGQDARGRRPHRVAARRSRAHADARPGQADEGRGVRRGRRAGRVLADGGRGRQAAGRRAAELVLARQAGAADAARARRRRRDQPLELALHDAGRAGRPGAGVRQRRRLDAGAVDRGVRRGAGRVHRRRRPAARRVQPRHRTGAGGRRRDRAQPGDRRRRLHRLDGHRPARRARRRRARRRCSRWAATDRWWCSRTATSTPRSRRR